MTDNRLLRMLQEHRPGYHPLVSMLEMAHEHGIEDQVRFNCHKTIAEYLEPRLKSVEVKGNVKADFGTLRVTMSNSGTTALPDDSENKQLEAPKEVELTNGT